MALHQCVCSCWDELPSALLTITWSTGAKLRQAKPDVAEQLSSRPPPTPPRPFGPLGAQWEGLKLKPTRSDTRWQSRPFSTHFVAKGPPLGPGLGVFVHYHGPWRRVHALFAPWVLAAREVMFAYFWLLFAHCLRTFGGSGEVRKQCACQTVQTRQQTCANMTSESGRPWGFWPPNASETAWSAVLFGFCLVLSTNGSKGLWQCGGWSGTQLRTFCLAGCPLLCGDPRKQSLTIRPKSNTSQGPGHWLPWIERACSLETDTSCGRDSVGYGVFIPRLVFAALFELSEWARDKPNLVFFYIASLSVTDVSRWLHLWEQFED